MSGITLDTGALIALDKNDRRVVVAVAVALERKLQLRIPAAAAIATHGTALSDLQPIEAKPKSRPRFTNPRPDSRLSHLRASQGLR